MMAMTGTEGPPQPLFSSDGMCPMCERSGLGGGGPSTSDANLTIEPASRHRGVQTVAEPYLIVDDFLRCLRGGERKEIRTPLSDARSPTDDKHQCETIGSLPPLHYFRTPPRKLSPPARQACMAAASWSARRSEWDIMGPNLSYRSGCRQGLQTIAERPVRFRLLAHRNERKQRGRDHHLERGRLFGLNS